MYKMFMIFVVSSLILTSCRNDSSAPATDCLQDKGECEVKVYSFFLEEDVESFVFTNWFWFDDLIVQKVDFKFSEKKAIYTTKSPASEENKQIELLLNERQLKYLQHRLRVSAFCRSEQALIDVKGKTNSTALLPTNLELVFKSQKQLSISNNGAINFCIPSLAASHLSQVLLQFLLNKL